MSTREMKTYHNVTMTQSIAYALYNCGEGVIDYTRGVLDTLGLSGLATALVSARAEWLQAVAERDKHCQPSGEDLMAQLSSGNIPAHLEEAVRVARQRLDEVLGELEILREQARHYGDGRTGGGATRPAPGVNSSACSRNSPSPRKGWRTTRWRTSG